MKHWNLIWRKARQIVTSGGRFGLLQACMMIGNRSWDLSDAWLILKTSWIGLQGWIRNFFFHKFFGTLLGFLEVGKSCPCDLRLLCTDRGLKLGQKYGGNIWHWCGDIWLKVCTKYCLFWIQSHAISCQSNIFEIYS